MVVFLIVSLLITLCLERNSVHYPGPTTGFEVATGRTPTGVYVARIIGMRVG